MNFFEWENVYYTHAERKGGTGGILTLTTTH